MSQATEKVALITDCNSDIGEAIFHSIEVSRPRYYIALAGKDTDKLNQLVEKTRGFYGNKFSTFFLDPEDPKSGKKLVEQVISKFKRLDLLVNNTDVFERTPGTDSQSYETFKQVTKVNCDMAIEITLAAVEHLKKSKGVIIFVSSVSSTKPSPGAYAYCMSKASIGMFARCLAIDLAPDVRVNIVSHNMTLEHQCKALKLNDKDTEEIVKDSTLIKKYNESVTSDVGNAILFLASDEAAFINGHEMIVDGGHLIKPSSFNVAQVVRTSRNET